MLLTFEINKQNITRTDLEHPVADSRNYLFAKFDFVTPEWDELMKSVVFWKGSKAYTSPLNEDNTCKVPSVVITPGCFYVSCFGGDLITNDKARVTVRESGYAKGVTPPDPEPDIYQTIINMYSEIKRLAQSVRDDADAGMFNGAAGPQGPPGEFDISKIINDDASSSDTTYSSNKINSLVSVFKNTLNIQIISTEEEFADFLENMNTHTLYLINNAIFGHEYYDTDCYVEIIVTQVGENFQYELVGSTAVTLGVVESYTYSKEELDNLGVRNIPSPLYVNNTLLNDVYGVPTRQRNVLFVDENYELMPITVRDNLVRVHFPVTKGKEYSEKFKIITYDADKVNIHFENNKEYRCYKALKKLNLSIDDMPTTEEAFECSLVFSVADTVGSFEFTAPDNISWIGDDCEDNVFTPQEGSNYEISIKWLGNIGGAPRLIARVGTF